MRFWRRTKTPTLTRSEAMMLLERILDGRAHGRALDIATCPMLNHEQLAELRSVVDKFYKAEGVVGSAEVEHKAGRLSKSDLFKIYGVSGVASSAVARTIRQWIKA